jgi:hypothetical protein
MFFQQNNILCHQNVLFSRRIILIKYLCNFVGADHGREDKERKPKQDIDKKYPKWDLVDYKFQDAQFFNEVRKLSSKGLDPKHDLTNEHVTTIDIAQVFGNVKGFQNHKSTPSYYCKERD